MDVAQIIAALISFQADVTPDLLAEIFGEHQREHLWLRWKRMDANALWFYGGLDFSNRTTLEKFLIRPRRTSGPWDSPSCASGALGWRWVAWGGYVVC